MDEIVAVVTDMFFQSRITATARHTGRAVRFLTSLQQVQACTAPLAFVDLDARVDAIAAIEALKESGVSMVVAFGPHLDTERRKAARTAGADRVLAKSKFVADLPNMLVRWPRPSEPA